MLVHGFPTGGLCLQALEGVKAVDCEGHLGQRHGDLLGNGILAVACVEGEIDLSTEVGLVGDTALESVAQVFVGGGGVVLVVVGADDVDVGREVVAGMGLGILLVGPFQLEVGALVGQSMSQTSQVI